MQQRINGRTAGLYWGKLGIECLTKLEVGRQADVRLLMWTGWIEVECMSSLSSGIPFE